MGHEVDLLESIRRIERELAIFNDIMKKIANILVMLLELKEVEIMGKEEEEDNGRESCH